MAARLNQGLLRGGVVHVRAVVWGVLSNMSVSVAVSMSVCRSKVILKQNLKDMFAFLKKQH